MGNSYFELRSAFQLRMKITYFVAIFVAALATAESDSIEERKSNKSDDNDLRPFNYNSKPTFLTDYVHIKNLHENREIHLVEGETLSLTCEAQSSRIPQIGWFKGNLRITEEIEEENDISPLGIVRLEQKFVAPCASVLHSGIYYCKGSTRGARDETGSTNVIVHRARPGTKAGCKITKGKARITLYSPTMMQEMGLDVVIPCRASGVPTPTIKWTKEDHSVPERFEILDNGDLFIPNLRWSDMGSYRCTAVNEFGSDSRSTFLYPLLKEQ